MLAITAPKGVGRIKVKHTIVSNKLMKRDFGTESGKNQVNQMDRNNLETHIYAKVKMEKNKGISSPR